MSDTKALIARAEKLLLMHEHIHLEEANAVQLHNALSQACMEEISENWIASEEKRKNHRQAFYLSAEYLTGRMVFNNLFGMQVLDEARALLSARGVDLSILEDIEDDAFGNGGLGRLAACFLDSAATHSIPLTGYGLRYRYGLFKQSFVDGRQSEAPDDWAQYGDPWSIRRLHDAVYVTMKDLTVRAVPYDMPVIGYGAQYIGTLRLWQCEAPEEVDFKLFNDQKYAQALARKNQAENITRFLYPNDTTREGKKLRVQQQYVLVSASLQDMMRQYELLHGDDYRYFAPLHAIQLNDTHPVMAIPELIRLLMVKGLDFEESFAIAQQTFAYTNHTVMQEALEKWDLTLLRAVCPELVRIIRMINDRFLAEMKEKHLPVLPTRCILLHGQVHMAQLAVYGTHATNGVAEIHSQILKDDLFSDWYAIYPERFQNKTNGITPRRWLGLCNPELTALIRERIGDGFLTDLDALEKLKHQIDDRLISDFQAVKHEKKQALADLIARETGYEVSPDMLFDVQVKRLHEYKRQLLNALSIIAIYHQLKNGTLKDFTPTCFIFGAKAAPGYDRAKAVIYLINRIAAKVNVDPDTSEKLKVIFLPNYNCSQAEIIIPAADVSEQISPAGTEASGTGNMKLMLNGAVTLGTYDGANVEIVQSAGRENNYIFGATVEEINAIRSSYNSKKLYQQNAVLRDALDSMISEEFGEEDPAIHELYTSLLEGASWHKPDHYFL
ncbi:MAG: glycogen/starch/alpha-glucan family phosphorylase, partial [Clostridia bacterium]|nr:glycogen/starch/alpha-glucan family phosphorylase [Clostridia bacterium]